MEDLNFELILTEEDFDIFRRGNSFYWWFTAFRGDTPEDGPYGSVDAARKAAKEYSPWP